ncbi:MAG TPA: hypothetical protein VK436_11815 [Methanocella sp.]|nr:hypothetical protein [Methanocella sp.]
MLPEQRTTAGMRSARWPVNDDRDTKPELKLKVRLEGSIPINGILSIWYPLWDMPL